MPMCEKCWSDAYLFAALRGISQAEAYRELLSERREHPCSPEEQAGQWWDEKEQRDTRRR